MNISILKILLTFLTILAISQTVFSQETGVPQETNLPPEPEAELFDRFGLVGCEDIWARQDAFFVALQNSPTSIGYAVIYGKKNATGKNLAREKLIKGIIDSRKYNEERLIIVRGKESDEPRTEFWLVPAGADKPDFEEVKWDLTFSEDQKPFIYYSSNEDDDICPTGANLETYSEYLTENPKSRANIVIYAKSKSAFQKQRKDFLDELNNSYNIPPKRIRFFFVKDTFDTLCAT